MKVVINRCYGGFGLSDVAIEKYLQLQDIKYRKTTNAYGHTHFDVINGEEERPFSKWDLNRHDPILVQVVEELGTEASNFFAKLEVVEVSDNTPYKINDYDGMESVSEFGDLSDDWIIP